MGRQVANKSYWRRWLHKNIPFSISGKNMRYTRRYIILRLRKHVVRNQWNGSIATVKYCSLSSRQLFQNLFRHSVAASRRKLRGSKQALGRRFCFYLSHPASNGIAASSDIRHIHLHSLAHPLSHSLTRSLDSVISVVGGRGAFLRNAMVAQDPEEREGYLFHARTVWGRDLA